jgi:hypothetical protein
MKMNQEEKESSARWKRYKPAYDLLINHIKNKTPGHKYSLDLVDLFYVRNFKGGSASINEDKRIVHKKLVRYSELIRNIDEKHSGKRLCELSEDRMISLAGLSAEFIKLSQNEVSKINGFGASFSSALLHAFFPDLLPILDRRAVNGSGILKVGRKEQVKDIHNYYEKLIEYYWQRVFTSKESIREVDRDLFSKPLSLKRTKQKNKL